ncbi:MAG TPA: hypothetical protein VJL59_16805, partial [Anaerolineales bacterium]|nr:hypothetical protein [Anaerolineales bacterium]
VIPIQVTEEGVIIPKVYLQGAAEVEVEMTAEYVIVRPKSQPAQPTDKPSLRHKPIRIYSPRLANRKRAKDFKMEVIAES